MTSLTKRLAAALLAVVMLAALVPFSALGAGNAIRQLVHTNFRVFRFTGALDDAEANPEEIHGEIDLLSDVYFVASNNVQMGGLSLWRVEGDELPPADYDNTGYYKHYTEGAITLLGFNGYTGGISGKNLFAAGGDYDFSSGKFSVTAGAPLKYYAGRDKLYVEPGRYRFCMTYGYGASSTLYYSDVYEITDKNEAAKNQGALDASWFVEPDGLTKRIPIDPDTSMTKFDLSLYLPEGAAELSEVTLLYTSGEHFSTDYYVYQLNGSRKDFTVGEVVLDDCFDGYPTHSYFLKGCEKQYIVDGNYRVKVKTTDGKVYVDNTIITFSEANNTPPVIDTASLPNGKVGVEYSASLAATAQSGGDISWSVVSGSLPTGLSLSENGTISGTPSASGTFSFTVRASESDAGSADKALTITVAKEDLAFPDGGNTDEYFTKTGDKLVPGGSFSLYLPFNRYVEDGDEATVTATVNYTDRLGAAKSFDVSFNTQKYWWGASAAGKLPDDVKSVDSVDYYMNGSHVVHKSLEVIVAPTLNVKITGSSATSLTLYVENEARQKVYSYSLWYGREFSLTNLAAGTYTLRLEGKVGSFGTMDFGSKIVTLENGAVTDAEIEIEDHLSASINIRAKIGATVESCGVEWYSDSEGTSLVSKNTAMSILDDGAYYVRVIPKYNSVYYLPSELVRVDRTSGEQIGYSSNVRTLTIEYPKKPTITVTGTALLASPDGGDPYAGGMTVTATRYGVEGYSHTTTNYYNSDANGAFTVDNVTEGTLITVSAGYGGLYGSASRTVTAAEIAAGSLDIDLTVPLADGVINVDVSTDDAGTVCASGVYMFSKYAVTKADGTELAARLNRQGKFDTIILEDPSAVSVGETLTLTAYSKSSIAGFPSRAGSTTFTVTNNGGIKYADADITLVARGYIKLNWSTTYGSPFALLIYDEAGSLIYTDRHSVSSGSTRGYVTTPKLPDGEYTLTMVNLNHFDTLAPEEYDTVAEAKALEWSKSVSASASNNNYTTASVTFSGSSFTGSTGNVITGQSGISMRASGASHVTVDVDITPTTSFAPESGVTVVIDTNQNNQTSLAMGYVNTLALSVNGKPFPIDRWNGNGIINTAGSISLVLTAEQVEAYGGFPMKISTTVTQTNLSELKATAYLKYSQNGARNDFIGDFAEATGALTIEAPVNVADGVFTVYGKGPSSNNRAMNVMKTYYVTIYANGVPLAKVETDNLRGYYKAKLALPVEWLEANPEINFVAIGAYEDGYMPLYSQTVTTEYTPTDAAMTKLSVEWEYTEGDFDRGRVSSLTILDDGDPVNINSAWYRGAHEGDKARTRWRVTFDNPEKVTAVVVYVPRNGETMMIDAVKQSDGTWLTPDTYFPGSSPDGVEVGFATVTEPNKLFAANAVSDSDLRYFYDRLASTDAIRNLTVENMKNLRFDLFCGEKSIPVELIEYEAAWDQSEVDELMALKPYYSYVEANDGDMFPNTVLRQEGMFIGKDLDGFEGDAAIFGVNTIERYTVDGDDSHVVFKSTTMTATRRVVVTWDAKDKTKSVSVIKLSGGEALSPAVSAGLDERIGASYLDEEEALTARIADMAISVYETWDTFYCCLADAFTEAANAEADGKAITDHASYVASFEPKSSRGAAAGRSVPQAFGYKFTDWDEVEDVAKQIEEAYKTGEDIQDWMREKEVTADEAAKLHRFLKDNYCMQLIYKTYQSDGNPGLFDIVPEVKELFGQRMTEQVKDALDSATNLGKEFSKEGFKAIGKAIVDKFEGDYNERVKDFARQRVFGRKSKSEGIAKRLYLAAKYAETYERNSANGGLCSEGIDWKNFPFDIYDPKDTDLRPLLQRYRDKQLSPVPVRTQKAPEGPHGRYDPSGYVYEAVPSNRIEGATVTLYTLDGDVTRNVTGEGTVESITGGAPIVVDSEYFGVEPNPQTTGADGRYQWFVPEGYWRVKVEADGFEGADSGSSAVYGLEATLRTDDGLYYMPVLPIQLDVNIPLVSYAAPTVESVSATTAGIVVKFSKYMDETTLNGANITLLVNGEPKSFSLTLADSERSGVADGAPSYTRTLLLTYAGAAEGDSVQIIIANAVTSYAGVAMDERYDSGALTLARAQTVGAVSFSAASGEVAEGTEIALSCATDGAKIYYTVDGSAPTKSSAVYTKPIIVTEAVTVKAFAVKPGMLDGAVSSATYTVPEPEVVTAPAKVAATIGGVAVEDGGKYPSGSVLTLWCETEGAEIFYTTSGICPMDDPSPDAYTAPIALEDGSYFFRIRSFKYGAWSEGLPLHFTVGETGYDVTVAAPENAAAEGELTQVAVAGEMQTVTVTAAEGYFFPEDFEVIFSVENCGLTVTRVDRTRITVSGTPAADVTVTVGAPKMNGDVNGDGKLNAKDVTSLMKHLIGQTPKTFYLAAADYNSDGKVNAKDVVAIMKFLTRAK